MCVCVCLCLSVKSHFASGASIRPENAVMDNVGPNVCGIFSETASLQSHVTSCIVGCSEVGHSLSGNTRVSLPSYERYQRLQRLKRANICSVFGRPSRMEADDFYYYRLQDRAQYIIFGHAHNASISDNT